MNESSINPTPSKKFKLTQISKFLSPASTSFNKLENASSQQEPPKQQRLKQTKSKVSKLNSSKLDESVNQGETKYFQKSSKTLKTHIDTASENKNNQEFKCPICSSDLTFSNDRQAHVNQCLDKGFSAKSATKPFKEILVEASTTSATDSVSKIPQLNIEDAVPNCPICGKEFRTLNVLGLLLSELFCSLFFYMNNKLVNI